MYISFIILCIYHLLYCVYIGCIKFRVYIHVIHIQLYVRFQKFCLFNSYNNYGVILNLDTIHHLHIIISDKWLFIDVFSLV